MKEVYIFCFLLHMKLTLLKNMIQLVALTYSGLK